MIFLGHKEGRSAQGALALLLRGNLVIEELLNVVDRKEMLTVHRDDHGIPDLRDENLGLVLDLHIGSGKNLRVDTLGQTGEDVPPWRPDGNTEVERSRDREQHVCNDVPEVGIQEEQDQVHEVHETEQDSGLVLAKNVADDSISQTVRLLHVRKNTNWVLDRQSQEEVGLSELGSKDQDPQAV